MDDLGKPPRLRTPTYPPTPAGSKGDGAREKDASSTSSNNDHNNDDNKNNKKKNNNYYYYHHHSYNYNCSYTTLHYNTRI